MKPLLLWAVTAGICVPIAATQGDPFTLGMIVGLTWGHLIVALAQTGRPQWLWSRIDER